MRPSGSRVTDREIGQRVGVGWHGGHCFQCSACRRGDFSACEDSLTTGLSTRRRLCRIYGRPLGSAGQHPGQAQSGSRLRRCVRWADDVRGAAKLRGQGRGTGGDPWPGRAGPSGSAILGETRLPNRRSVPGQGKGRVGLKAGRPYLHRYQIPPMRRRN